MDKKDKDHLNEPVAPYIPGEKKITFLNTFEEAEEYQRRIMAGMTVEERMNHLEEMRKRFMSECLLPDGTWRPLKRVITIEKTNFNELP